MSDIKKLKFAVISDPHVYNGTSGDSCPSWIAMGDDQSNPRQNPFSGLKKLIDAEKLTADFVICGGDLGDRAVPQAQQYAWSEIQNIAKLLGASEVVGAAGNHDIDSRFSYTDFDAKGQVLALNPTFPVARKENWLEYWARNFTVFESCGIRFLLLNSSAFHGAQKKDAKPEFEQGRVSDRTMDAIFTDSRLNHEVSVNILICHHHPMKNEKIKISDYSQMENGDQLVNRIEKHDKGPWLVIHGHKHLPRIYYAPGGNSAATIFSAGSFAAKPYPEIQEIARNEFYILEVDVPTTM